MSTATDRRPSLPLFSAAAVSVVGGLWLMLWYWPGALPYDITSGVWTTLAEDTIHGQFYRPVHGPLGYGGTRYMPLQFVLHAALMATGVPAATAGMALTFVCLALLGICAFRLMRTLAATTPIAWACVALVPASIGFQLLTVAVKADVLAAACSAGGLAAAVHWQERGRMRHALLACVCFAAAILAKFTDGFAFAAIVVWLVVRRQRTKAGVLLAGTLGLVALGLAAAVWASEGRIVDAFAACATGGASFSYGWRFLAWFTIVAVQDPFFLALFVAAIIAARRRWRRNGLDLATCYFVITALGTTLIFASPGTDSNHLVDLLVASVAVLAVEISHGSLGGGARWAASAFACAVVATWLPGMPSVRHYFAKIGRPTRAAVEELAARLTSAGTRRLLSENPLLPIMLGQRPEVMDCFSLRLVAGRTPSVKTEFLENLSARRYTAVVLQDWSGAPPSGRWNEIAAHTSLGVETFYGGVHFPPGFLAALDTSYRLSFVAGPFVVFEPRPR
ncbi:MAG: hypothetical protein RLZZ15_978 [Verrucomicrobiota bacterium]